MSISRVITVPDSAVISVLLVGRSGVVVVPFCIGGTRSVSRFQFFVGMVSICRMVPVSRVVSCLAVVICSSRSVVVITKIVIMVVFGMIPCYVLVGGQKGHLYCLFNRLVDYLVDDIGVCCLEAAGLQT